MFTRIFKNYINGRIGDSKSAIVSYRTAGISSLSDYIDLSEKGYKKNVVVYRCVQLISRALASVDWILQKSGDEDIDEVLYDHEILRLMEKPNMSQYKTTFIEEAVSYLLLSGNCYIMLERDKNDTPASLYLLRPDRMRIIPGNGSFPLGYEYNAGKDKRRLFQVNQETGESDILHIKLFNPLNDWYGMSPIEVASASINQHNAIALQNTSFLQNGGRPSGALMYKSAINPEKRGELKENLRNLYEGGRNAGKILLLEGDFEWKEMGLSPKDLDFISGKELAAKEIALAFGVPNILIGSMSSATFSNYKEARYNFWEETLIPLLNMFTGELSNWFQMIFKTDLKFWYDLDSIPALVKKREIEWRKINNAEFLTKNEKREAFGYTPIKQDN